MTTERNAQAGDDVWPRTDYSRVPYWLYWDPDLYKQELARIFQGPTWSYVGFEAEIPKPGDFRTSFVGDVPVIVNRDEQGQVHVLVNRCAHRGAIVRREACGNAVEHGCIYHRWLYRLDGSLQGVPFSRGHKGRGGLSADFDFADHGLKRLRLAIFCGIIFVSFDEAAEPLEAYLGERICSHLKRLMARPIRILGYQRQKIRGNWKQYIENQRDTYHGSLLHEFQSTFGISRATQVGGVSMDDRHRHNLTWAKTGTDDEAEAQKAYADAKVHESRLKLLDPAMLKYHREFDDGISLAICGVFPNATFHQISNSLAGRQLRPQGPDCFELHWTLFGYEDDPPEMTEHRLLQANMVGPAGLISMEDGEAIEISYRSALAARDECSVVEMGGRGPIRSLDHRINDVPVRGFWSYWSELMGLEPTGGER